MFLDGSRFRETFRSGQVQDELSIQPDTLNLEVVAILHRLGRLEEANVTLESLAPPRLLARVVMEGNTMSISVPSTPVSVARRNLFPSHSPSLPTTPQQPQTPVQANPDPIASEKPSPVLTVDSTTPTLPNLSPSNLVLTTPISAHPTLATPVSDHASLTLLADTTINTPLQVLQPLPEPSTPPVQTTTIQAQSPVTPTPLPNRPTTPSTIRHHQTIEVEAPVDKNAWNKGVSMMSVPRPVLALRNVS